MAPFPPPSSGVDFAPPPPRGLELRDSPSACGGSTLLPVAPMRGQPPQVWLSQMEANKRESRATVVPYDHFLATGADAQGASALVNGATSLRNHYWPTSVRFAPLSRSPAGRSIRLDLSPSLGRPSDDSGGCDLGHAGSLVGPFRWPPLPAESGGRRSDGCRALCWLPRSTDSIH